MVYKRRSQFDLFSLLVLVVVVGLSLTIFYQLKLYQWGAKLPMVEHLRLPSISRDIDG